MEDCTGECVGDGKRGRHNRLVKKDSRKGDRVSRGKKAVIRDRGSRTSKECFLKAEYHWNIRGNELMMDVPRKNRYDKKGTKLRIG